MATIAERAGGGAVRRHSFLEKLVLAAALVTLADHFFFLQRIGTSAGIFALAVLAALALTVRPIWSRSPAAAAAGAALVPAAALLYDPSLLAAALFWTAAMAAVLLPRSARFDDGWRWARRLLWHALVARSPRSAISPASAPPAAAAARSGSAGRRPHWSCRSPEASSSSPSSQAPTR